MESEIAATATAQASAAYSVAVGSGWPAGSG